MRPSADDIGSYLSYDPISGNLTWIKQRGTIRVGHVVQTVETGGYFVVRFRGVLYCAHVIAWLLHSGVWPEQSIDHIDGNKQNNALNNLRPASFSQNMRNRGKNRSNTSGLKGVWQKKSKPSVWFATITSGGKCVWLGTFKSKADAHDAYVQAATKLHGDFANVG